MMDKQKPEATCSQAEIDAIFATAEFERLMQQPPVPIVNLMAHRVGSFEQ